MMTPRGVADVQVYTPARVEARYGIRPDQIPDFIGLKGDTSDNIPGIPGIGDKTAGQLIGRFGSLEAVIEHAGELTPAPVAGRHRARRPGAGLEGARDDAARPRHRLRAGPARARAARPLAAEGDLPPLRVPQPALAARHARRGAPGGVRSRSPASEVPWREGDPDRRAAASASRLRAIVPPSRPTKVSSVGPRPAQDRRRARRARCEISRVSTRPMTRCSRPI